MREPQRSAGEHQERDKPMAHKWLLKEVTGSPCPGHEDWKQTEWSGAEVAVAWAATLLGTEDITILLTE